MKLAEDVIKQTADSNKLRIIKTQRELSKLEQDMAREGELATKPGPTDWVQAKQDALQDLQDQASVIPFINSDFSQLIQPVKRDIVMIAAETGTGKTTISAHIVSGCLDAKKRVLVITNEEAKQDFIVRIGCFKNGYNYNEYKNPNSTKYDLPTKMLILDQALKCTTNLEVIDLSFNRGATSTVEGVQNILDNSKNQYDVVIIDYFQNISTSTKTTKTYEALKMLSDYLKDVSKDIGCPIIMFGQLKATSVSKDWKERIEQCKVIANHLTHVVLFTREEDSTLGGFSVVKNRHGAQLLKALTNYENGKLKCLSIGNANDMKQAKLEFTVKKIDEQSNKE